MYNSLFIIILLFIINVFSASFADLQYKLNGYLEFQSANLHQKKVKRSERNLSANHNKVVFSTSGNAKLEISNTTDTDIQYGARIVLKTITNSGGGTSANNSHIFVQGNFGKIDIGSPPDAATTMRVTGLDVTQSTKTDWSAYVKLNPKSEPGLTFIVNPFPLLGKISGSKTEKASKESARKITYYTPEYNGLQFGVSYIPDTSNKGVFSRTRDYSNKFKVPGINPYTVKVEAKDLFTLGVTYTYKPNSNVSAKFSLTGEVGKAIQKQIEPIEEKLSGDRKLNNLRSYNVGMMFKYNNISYAISYTNAGKSLTSKDMWKNRKRKTEILSTGISYVANNVGVSLTYLKTNFNQNKLNAVTLGTKYDKLPGLIPYAEISLIKTKGKGINQINNNATHKDKMVVGLIGLVLKF